MRSVFITGTDTGVGKTLVCGLLGRFMLEKGHSVVTQKWIETGTEGFSVDINKHLQLMKVKRRDINSHLGHMSPYVFNHASSPHLSSAMENKKINAAAIMKSFGYLRERFDSVLVEGTGGFLVPFNRRERISDIARDLKLPVLIVAANKLGAINHILLTVEAVKKRGMKIAGIVFNEHPGKEDERILKDNPRIVRELAGESTLGTLPWSKDVDLLRKAFTPVGKKILAYLKENRRNG